MLTWDGLVANCGGLLGAANVLLEADVRGAREDDLLPGLLLRLSLSLSSSREPVRSGDAVPRLATIGSDDVEYLDLPPRLRSSSMPDDLVEALDPLPTLRPRSMPDDLLFEILPVDPPPRLAVERQSKSFD